MMNHYDTNILLTVDLIATNKKLDLTKSQNKLMRSPNK